MTQKMKVLSDGTIKFYQNKYVSLCCAVCVTICTIVLAFLFIHFKLVPNMGLVYKIFTGVILIELISDIFFFIRFIKPKTIIALNDEGIIAPFSVPYSQIVAIIYEKRSVASLLNSNITDLAKSQSLRDNCLVFRTKDEKAYKFHIDVLTAQNKQALRDYLEKKGFTYQG